MAIDVRVCGLGTRRGALASRTSYGCSPLSLTHPVSPREELTMRLLVAFTAGFTLAALCGLAIALTAPRPKPAPSDSLGVITLTSPAAARFLPPAPVLAPGDSRDDLLP